MRADYRVVLDACVLIPMPLADTLLRMAEAPRLYLPRLSKLIMDEATRNLIAKWDMPMTREASLCLRAVRITRYYCPSLLSKLAG